MQEALGVMVIVSISCVSLLMAGFTALIVAGVISVIREFKD